MTKDDVVTTFTTNCAAPVKFRDLGGVVFAVSDEMKAGKSLAFPLGAPDEVYEQFIVERAREFEAMFAEGPTH
jgi:hypothetical protein